MNEIKYLVRNFQTGECEIRCEYQTDNELKKYKDTIYQLARKQGNPNKIPNKLYHVTLEENIESINANGLRCGNDGCVYLTSENKLEEVIKSINIYYPNKNITILEIPTRRLLKFQLFSNIDGHKKGYMYFGDIKRDKICNIGEM